MKTRCTPAMSLLCLMALAASACRKLPQEVTVSEQRVATIADEGQKLDATSSDRFQEPGNRAAPNSPILATVVPESWLSLPGNEFRLLNYRFGSNGEVSVGIARGGVVENLNRWRKQFDQPALDAAQVDQLPPFGILNGQGVWVEMEGDFSPGMGQEKRGEQALAGVIAEDSGNIITVKMTGSKDDVSAQKEALKGFIQGLRYR